MGLENGRDEDLGLVLQNFEIVPIKATLYVKVPFLGGAMVCVTQNKGKKDTTGLTTFNMNPTQCGGEGRGPIYEKKWEERPIDDIYILYKVQQMMLHISGGR